jgi:subtilisin family serine protease
MMPRRAVTVALGLALGILALISPSAASAGGTIHNYVVVLKDSTSDPGAVASDEGRRYGFTARMVYGTVLKGYAASMTDAAAAALPQDDSRVEFVSPDRNFTAIGATRGQTLPTGVNRIDADVGSTLAGNGIGSIGVPIAVIDSGSTHPDLNVVGGKGCVPNSTSYADGNGHGTHVAGTAAAKDDGSGVVGVAPGAPVWSVRVLGNNGSGTTSSLVCGVDWVTANAAATGIKVANMSIAGAGSDDGNCGRTNADALHLAICNSVAKGVTYVVGAGNTGTNLASTVPAAYDEVLTVTGMADFNGQPGGGAASTCQQEVDDTSYDFSNFATAGGPDVAHTIAAPAVCIYSTYRGGGYATMTGTSMATAHVSGAVASCLGSGACAGLSPAGIISRLRSDAAARPVGYGFTGDPNSPSTGRYFGNLVYAGGY